MAVTVFVTIAMNIYCRASIGEVTRKIAQCLVQVAYLVECGTHAIVDAGLVHEGQPELVRAAGSRISSRCRRPYRGGSTRSRGVRKTVDRLGGESAVRVQLAVE